MTYLPPKGVWRGVCQHLRRHLPFNVLLPTTLMPIQPTRMNG